MRILKIALIILVAAIIVLFAARLQKSLRLVQRAKLPVSGWVLAAKNLSVSQEKLQLSDPIPVTTPELIVSDRTGRQLLVPQVLKDRIIYHWIDLESGARQSFERKWNADMPLPAAVVDAEAAALYFLNIDGQLTKRDVQGRVEWQTAPFPDYVFTYENTYWLSLTTGGRLIAVISYPEAEGKPKFRTMIMEYSPGSNLLSQRELKDFHAFQWAVNPDGTRRLLSGTYRTRRETRAAVRTLLLNDQNETVWQGRQPFRKAVFLPQGRFAILQKRNLAVIDESSGAVVRQWTPQVAQALFSDLVFDTAGTLVVVEGLPDYHEGKLRFQNATLRFIQIDYWTEEKVDLKDRKYLPGALKIKQSGTCLLGTSDGLYQVEY